MGSTVAWPPRAMDADAQLPQIQLPDTFPAWLVATEGGADEALFRPSSMTTGARRLRRMYTWAPVLRSVSLLLTEQQTREFEWFFENDLLAGSRMFAARVRDMGPGHAWYAAQFAEENPLTYTPMIGWARNNDIRWKVDCKLVLYGTPRVAGPVLTSFKGVVRVPLLGRARNAGVVTLSGAAVVALAGTAASPWALSGEIEVDITGAVEEPEGLPFYGRVSIPLAGLVASVQPMTLAAEISVPLVGEVA